MKNKEFEAWIISNGTRLPELCVEKNDRTVHCFIPCEVGKTFEVRWRDKGSKKFTAGYIFVDGFVCPGRYLHGCGETYRTGARASRSTERPFMFAAITNDAPGGSGSISKVGSIILKIQEVHRTQGQPANEPQIPPIPTHSQADAAMTGGVCLGFGDAVEQAVVQSPFTWGSQPVDPNWNHSYVKFEFKYRSRTWLQQQGLLPRDAPSQALAVPRPAPEGPSQTDVQPDMGGNSHAFAISVSDRSPKATSGAVLLPTMRVGDVANGTPARVASNKYPRGLDGTVTMVRNVSGSSAGVRDDKAKGGASTPARAARAPASTPRMPDAGELVQRAPPSSRPPIFGGPNSLYILPPGRSNAPQRRVPSGPPPQPIVVPQIPLVNFIIPTTRGSRTNDLSSLGPGIGAPPNPNASNLRRPLGLRNVSNSSDFSVQSSGSAASGASVPSTTTAGRDDWQDFLNFDQMDESF